LFKVLIVVFDGLFLLVNPVGAQIALQYQQWPQSGHMATFRRFAWLLEELFSGAALDNAVEGRLADHLTPEQVQQQ
jgi:hypothetical protein